MTTYMLAFLIGIVAGLRSLTAPAAISWGARLAWLRSGSGLSAPVTTYVLSAFAIGELITDKLPKTPSRKAPLPFAFRVLSGAFCGWVLGSQSEAVIGGLLAGALGAVAGTVGGYEARRRLVKAMGGKDLPIALLEDALAVGGAFWIASQFS
jgi:uncharacterized membrane protein